MYKRTLCKHQIELSIQALPSLGDSSRVAEHTQGAWHFAQITVGNDSRRLVIQSNLEASRAPIDKLNTCFWLRYHILE